MILYIKTARMKCTVKYYKQPINKICFNNINTLLVYMWSYLCKQRSKQTKLCTLFQKLVLKVVKKETSNMEVYYIIPLNYQLAGHPENFKVKIYYFQEGLSLR